jgi:hypothetical protein
MKRMILTPIAAAFVLTAACGTTDPVSPPTTPQVVPDFAASGTGSPKFAKQFTDCSATSSLISCDYKISGLGNTDVVDVFLTAPVHVEADCRNPGGNVAPGQAFETNVTASQLQLRPENGQITNSISISASDAPNPVASEVCPNPQWTVVNVRKTFSGGFDLFAVVHHQNGSDTRIESGL